MTRKKPEARICNQRKCEKRRAHAIKIGVHAVFKEKCWVHLCQSSRRNTRRSRLRYASALDPLVYWNADGLEVVGTGDVLPAATVRAVCPIRSSKRALPPRARLARPPAGGIRLVPAARPVPEPPVGRRRVRRGAEQRLGLRGVGLRGLRLDAGYRIEGAPLRRELHVPRGLDGEGQGR